MNKIVRFYNQNRIMIWFCIITICIVIAIIQILNSQYKLHNSVNNSSSSNNTTAIINNSNNNNLINSSSNNTNISNVVTSEKQAINKFLNLCNKGEIDSAYKMIDDNCKLALYPTKEDFVNTYYNTYFDTEKVFNITSWNSYSYKVIFSIDPITTGSVDNSSTMIDYMYVVATNGSYKINISGFLKKESMNISKNSSYLNVNIVERQVFKDYEVYTLKVKNLTKADIYIDNLINSNMYIVDGKSNKFYLNSSDYTEEDFKILADNEKSFKLKFNRKYNTSNVGSYKLVFGNMIIQNKKYTVESVTETNQIEIKERTTTYPESAVMEISLK